MVVQQTTSPSSTVYLEEAICTHVSGPSLSKTISSRGLTKHSIKAWKSLFCLSPLRGNLHVLLSSSVSLILPLILLGPRVKPKVHIQTEPGQQSRGLQSMKWKKKTTLLPSLTKPQRNSQAHLMRLIKWLISYWRWSVVHTMLRAGNRHWGSAAEYINSCCQNQWYSCWCCEFRQCPLAGQSDLCTKQYLITRANLIIYGPNFLYCIVTPIVWLVQS